MSMPVSNWFEAARIVKTLARKVKVVFLSMNSDPQIAMRAYDAGASGFLPKTCAASELLIAFRTVLESRTYMSPSLREAVDALRWAGIVPTEESCRLTAREREVLQLLAEGKNMKQVGEILKVTRRTVGFHKYRIKEVLGAKNNADLVRFALRSGMIPISEATAKR